jgi:hypothetical protein
MPLQPFSDARPFASPASSMTRREAIEDGELAGLLQCVRGRATPQALAFQILKSDILFHRLRPGQWPSLIQAALGDGVRTADRARARFHTTDPWAIAASLGIPVERADEEAGYGRVRLYAEYVSKPPIIRLYGPAMARLNRYLANRAINEIVGTIDAVPAFIAHELYHHFDAAYPSGPLKRRHQILVLRIGRWSLESGLASLAEIAAGAFAQTLLDLPFHPKLFDVIALFDDNPAAASAMVQAI